jgi:hypothetical protein
MDWTERVETYVHTLGKGTARQYRAALEDFGRRCRQTCAEDP